MAYHLLFSRLRSLSAWLLGGGVAAEVRFSEREGRKVQNKLRCAFVVLAVGCWLTTVVVDLFLFLTAFFVFACFAPCSVRLLL